MEASVMEDAMWSVRIANRKELEFDGMIKADPDTLFCGCNLIAGFGPEEGLPGTGETWCYYCCQKCPVCLLHIFTRTGLYGGNFFAYGMINTTPNRTIRRSFIDGSRVFVCDLCTHRVERIEKIQRLRDEIASYLQKKEYKQILTRRIIEAGSIHGEKVSTNSNRK